MKPILIIRVPKDAVDSIPQIKEHSYRSFKKFKVKVVFDDDKQKGFKFSLLNPTLSTDEEVEREFFEQMPGVDFVRYTVKTKVWQYESNSLLNLFARVFKARLKNFFYFGKWED